MHNIIGAGVAEGSINAAAIMKPPLSRGQLQVIGATTFTEYRKFLEKILRSTAAFQTVNVKEPTLKDASLRLFSRVKGLLRGVSLRACARFHRGAECEASERYIQDRFLPDKAIDVLDEAGAHLRHPQHGPTRRGAEDRR